HPRGPSRSTRNVSFEMPAFGATGGDSACFSPGRFVASHAPSAACIASRSRWRPSIVCPAGHSRARLVPARGFCSSRPVRASDDRILTTHAGSLPRPPALRDLLVLASRREPVDAAALESAVDAATHAIVARQLDVGIDVGNDGEQGRESFFTYVQ